MAKIEFECDFCNTDISSTRHRFYVHGEKKDACEPCFTNQQATLTIENHTTFQAGEAEKEDYEDYFECNIDQILSFGMFPYQIVSIGDEMDEEDQKQMGSGNNFELIISNEFYDPDTLSEAAVIVDSTMLDLLLNFFDVEAIPQLMGKIFLTNESSASAAMHALALVFAKEIEEVMNKNKKPKKITTKRGKILLKYLRVPPSTSEITNKIVNAFCNLEPISLDFLTGSEKSQYLNVLFGVTNAETLDRDSTDHAHQWLNSIAQLVKERSNNQINCEIASPSCKFPNIVEVPYDLRIHVFLTDPSTVPHLLVQLTPFGAGWFCHSISN